MPAEERAPAGTPLYVHLPYCAEKCPYCDFYSVAERAPDVDGTIETLLAEAEARAPRSPRTVFCGGGTPSYLSIPQLRRFLDGLDRRTGFRASAEEVTVECNPESLDRFKVEALLELGVNRLSIGFQSLRPEVLELFGRVHDVDASWRALEAARRGGCTNVNVDLIYAYPDQKTEHWTEDLRQVLDAGIQHLAAYNLTYEPGTAFKTWLDAGRLAQLDEELELELFHATRELASGANLEPYEISNFALAGYLCSHNVNYWHNGDYLGIGPSAVSKLGPHRFGNARSIGAWGGRVRSGSSPREWEERPDDAARLGETWWLGLRLARGLTAAEARARSGLPAAGPAEAPDAAERMAERLRADGLLERDGEGRYRLGPRGLPLADAVAREFLVLDEAGEAAAPARA